MRIMQDELRIIGGLVCSIKRNLFTCDIEVTDAVLLHERRYCYEHAKDARAALAAWDGQGHPPGPWIKCKSATQEILNPVWSAA